MSEQAKDWALALADAGAVRDGEAQVLLALADAHMPGDSAAVHVSLADLADAAGVKVSFVMIALHGLHGWGRIGLPQGIGASVTAVLKFNALTAGVELADEGGEGAV